MRSRAAVAIAIAIAVVASLSAGTGVAAAETPARPSIDNDAITAEALIGLEYGDGLTADDSGDLVVVTKVAAGPWQALGVRAGDAILSVDGEEVESTARLLTQSVSLRYKAVAYVEVMRGTKAVLLRRAVAPPTTTITPPPAPGDALSAELDAIIKQTGAHTWEVDVDAVLVDPMRFAKGARVTPSIKGGKPNGIKLYAIRPSSAFARLGLMNGDTVTSVNGLELTSMDKALEVYAKVRDADTVVVTITRRGKPVANTYVRRQPGKKL